MRHECKFKDHRCHNYRGEPECCNLLQYRNLDTGRYHVIDQEGRMYNSVQLFRKGIKAKESLNSEDKQEAYGSARILCNICENLEFKTESCLNTHLFTWHEDQTFVEGFRPRDHKCNWDGHCIELIEEINENGSTTLYDSLEYVYESVEHFRNSLASNTTTTLSPTKKKPKCHHQEIQDLSSTADSLPPLEDPIEPTNYQERKRKQNSPNSSSKSTTNKKQATSRESNTENVFEQSPLMSQSLPEELHSPRSLSSKLSTSEEQISFSFVNQQTQKFEMFQHGNNSKSTFDKNTKSPSKLQPTNDKSSRNKNNQPQPRW